MKPDPVELHVVVWILIAGRRQPMQQREGRQPVDLGEERDDMYRIKV
jgi:hypothetical protein